MPTIDRFLYIANQVLTRATRGSISLIRYYFVAQPVPEGPLWTSKRGSRFSIRTATAVDAVVGSAPRPQAVLQRRFDDGATCIVAESNGKLAGFIWLMEGRYMEDEVRCLYELQSEAKAAWDFDVYVAPEYRATRLFSRLWDSANEWLSGRGYRWTFSRISGFNVASLTAHGRMGTTALGSGTFLVVGPVQLSILSMRPFIHLALTRRSFVMMTLPPDLKWLAARRGDVIADDEESK